MQIPRFPGPTPSSWAGLRSLGQSFGLKPSSMDNVVGRGALGESRGAFQVSWKQGKGPDSFLILPGADPHLPDSHPCLH